VFVDTVHLSGDVFLNSEEKELILNFHKYTFSTVLRYNRPVARNVIHT
jgi:hypothetical protein